MIKVCQENIVALQLSPLGVKATKPEEPLSQVNTKNLMLPSAANQKAEWKN